MATHNSRINAIIERRRAARADELDMRRKEIFKRFPRIEEIERRLDETGMQLINCVLDGSCNPEEAVRRIMAENAAVNAEKQKILINNGYSPDYIDDKPQCEKCGDLGRVNGAVCSCVRTELNRELMNEANLSEKLSAQTFDAFRFDYYSSVPDEKLGVSPRENIESVYRLCRSFAENFSSTDKNLFFTGDCGLGKTFLSSAIANYLIEAGTDVLYVSSNSLFPILEDLHFNRGVSEKNQDLVQHVFDCELLILDDLGAEFITPFTTAELFRIINNRLLSDKKTIISTNMDSNELKTKYSPRIYSRVAGSFEFIVFFGDDIRRKLKDMK